MTTYGHCKHCPRTCRTDHDAPAVIDCADCLTAYEKYLDTIERANNQEQRRLEAIEDEETYHFYKDTPYL